VNISPETGKSPGKKISCTYGNNWLNVNFIWDGKPVIIEVLDGEKM